MSSEMWEALETLLTMRAHAVGTDERCAEFQAYKRAACDFFTVHGDQIERALLARTEAGADGAVGYVSADGNAVWLTEGSFSLKPAAGTNLFTHPQDASGDAERFAFLASKAKQDRAYDVFGAGGHWGIGIHSDDGNLTFREAVDAAMQAKEAK